MEKERKKRTPFEKLKPFTDAQRSLMAEWYPWAMHYADVEIKRRAEKREKIPSWVIEDAAVNALIRSVIRYDPERGVAFKTYFHRGFYMNVWNAVKEYCESRDNHISENTPVRGESNDNDDDILRLKDTNPFAEDSFEDEIIAKIDFERLMSKLSPWQAEAVSRVYMFGERQSDIAREYGVSRQNVNNAVRAAVKYLRTVCGEEYDIGRGRNRQIANA